MAQDDEGWAAFNSPPFILRDEIDESRFSDPDHEHELVQPVSPQPGSPNAPYNFKRAADRLIEAFLKAATLVESIKSREREKSRGLFMRWRRTKLDGQPKVLHDALKAGAAEISKACQNLKSVDPSSRGDGTALLHLYFLVYERF